MISDRDNIEVSSYEVHVPSPLRRCSINWETKLKITFSWGRVWNNRSGRFGGSLVVQIAKVTMSLIASTPRLLGLKQVFISSFEETIFWFPWWTLQTRTFALPTEEQLKTFLLKSGRKRCSVWPYILNILLEAFASIIKELSRWRGFKRGRKKSNYLYLEVIWLYI